MLSKLRAADAWLFWIAASLVIGAGLGLRDPWPADEPRFALVAKTMVDSGDWLFPRRGIELYSDKPPLLMWLQAGAYTLLRDWRLAFLLPSLLASLGTLWCVVDLGRRLWTRRVGLYAGWAVLCAFQFAYQAKKAQIDPLVTFWITLANYGLLRHLLCGRGRRSPHWPMWWLGWFAAGLGTISKGVGAIALLMLVPALFAAARVWPGVRLHARAPRFWLGPVAFLAAVSLWLAPMALAAIRHPDPAYQAYMHDILFRQTLDRYAKSWDHPQPPWYFAEVMLVAWLPTILALPWAWPAWRRRLRRRDPRYLLPLAWWGLVVLFFSLPSGKRDVYILPALPMFALALAPLLPGLVRRCWPRRIAFALALTLAACFLLAGIAMLLGEPAFERRLLSARGLTEASEALAWMLVAIGAWAAAAVLGFGRRRPFAAMLASLAGLWIWFGLLGYPALNDSSSARGVMHAVGRRLGPSAELGLVAWKEQIMLMADRPARDFGFQRPAHLQLAAALAWQAAVPARRWLLVQEFALGRCIDRRQAEFIGQSGRRRWWLAPAAAAVPGCTPQAEADDTDDAE